MMHRLVSSVTFLGQILKLAYHTYRSLSTILFVITFGDLNIDLTQKKVIYKSCRPFNEISNAVCRLSLRLVVFEI